MHTLKFLLHNFCTLWSFCYITFARFEVSAPSLVHTLKFLLHNFCTLWSFCYITFARFEVSAPSLVHTLKFLLHNFCTLWSFCYITFARFEVSAPSLVHTLKFLLHHFCTLWSYCYITFARFEVSATSLLHTLKFLLHHFCTLWSYCYITLAQFPKDQHVFPVLKIHQEYWVLGVRDSNSRSNAANIKHDSSSLECQFPGGWGLLVPWTSSQGQGISWLSHVLANLPKIASECSWRVSTVWMILTRLQYVH